MKTLLPLLLLSLMLAGCPEVKNPKLPPNVPAPVTHLDTLQARGPAQA